VSGICSGRVVIITGAGRGLGRAHALAFAAEGAKVIVNDLGTASDGEGRSSAPAEEVAATIRDAGGEAVVNTGDVASWSDGKAIVEQALDTFGRLDVVVNNAGFLRDRMFVSSREDEWDAVMRVHVKGHVCISRHAAEHWRARSKAGETNAAAIINTSSGAGLRGAVGQGAYSAAKAAIAGLTLVQAAELGRYGVTANAIAPAARTRMTEVVFGEMMAKPEGGFDEMAPENVSPLVVWLGSNEGRDVSGRLFEVSGGKISLADGWRLGPEIDRGERWVAGEVGAAVRDLIGQATPPEPAYGAQ